MIISIHSYIVATTHAIWSGRQPYFCRSQGQITKIGLGSASLISFTCQIMMLCCSNQLQHRLRWQKAFLLESGQPSQDLLSPCVTMNRDKYCGGQWLLSAQYCTEAKYLDYRLLLKCYGPRIRVKYIHEPWFIHCGGNVHFCPFHIENLKMENKMWTKYKTLTLVPKS